MEVVISKEMANCGFDSKTSGDLNVRFSSRVDPKINLI